MHQTRSVRIDLSKFTPSSENRRILKKTEGVILSLNELPMKAYDFTIGKLGKDFYDTKFGAGIMSAQKIKEMLTDITKSNFNTLLTYSMSDDTQISPIGYTIAFTTPSMLHYSYPFYNMEKAPKDMGLGMMLRAVISAKEAGMSYVYLGSYQRPNDSYKLQFEGLEWFDSAEWVPVSDRKPTL